MAIVPSNKPRLSDSDLLKIISAYKVDRNKYPLVVVGVRGFYLDMGKQGINDRNIYDDAIFINSLDASVAYNGNTDPSKCRKGHGTAESTRGMASLKPGIYYAYKFDLHGGKYLALCQRAAQVTVIRDGDPPYEHTGWFGINIHKGGYNTTSSEGCQTIYPTQWNSFINLAVDQANRFFGSKWKEKCVVPYILLERNDMLKIIGYDPVQVI